MFKRTVRDNASLTMELPVNVDSLVAWVKRYIQKLLQVLAITDLAKQPELERLFQGDVPVAAHTRRTQGVCVTDIQAWVVGVPVSATDT